MQLFVAVALQCVAVAVAALLCWPLAGLRAAASLLIGGACCIVPWALLALREALRRGQSPASLFSAFIVGEFAKVGLICAMLFAAHRWLEPLVWPAVVTGLLIALKMPLFALLYPGRDAAPRPVGPSAPS